MEGWKMKRTFKERRWNLTMGSTLSVITFFSILPFAISTPLLLLNCSEINKNSTCECTQLSNSYQIDCPKPDYKGPIPEKGLTFPISMKVLPFNNDFSFLEVTCLPGESLTKAGKGLEGVSFSSPEKLSLPVKKLTFTKCRIEDTNSVEQFLSVVKLSPSEIQRLSILETDMTRIDDKVIAAFRNVTVLNLSRNQLVSVPVLEDFHHLEEFSAHSNRIGEVKVGTFPQSLKRIVLRGNPLREMREGSFPSLLEHLDLSSGVVSAGSFEALKGLRKLKSLLLEMAELKRTDPSFLDFLEDLELLSLKGAKLKSFPSLRNLTNLINLTLDYVRTEDKGASLILENLPKLETLRGTWCKLESLPTLQRSFPSLRRIFLSGNKIPSLSPEFFSKAQGLIEVDLQDNYITSLPAEGIMSPNMEKLVLKMNRISSLGEKEFQYLFKLREMDLSKNKISTVDLNTFSNQRDLWWLDLSENSISFEDSPYKGKTLQGDDPLLGGFGSPEGVSFLNKATKLRHLNLSRNAFKRIFEDWKINLLEIEELDLSYNNLTGITAVDLNFITRRNLNLDLRNNQITRVDFTNYWLLKENSPSPTDVLLQGNPLNCDCFAYTMKTAKLKSPTLHLEGVVCQKPDYFKGTLVLNVPDKYLLCPLAPGSCPLPTPCSCWNRPSDSTLLVNCSNLGLSSQDLHSIEGGTTNAISMPRNKKSPANIAFDFSSNAFQKVSNDFVRGLPENTNFVDFSNNKLESMSFLLEMREGAKVNFSLSGNPFQCSNCDDVIIPWGTFNTRISDSENLTCFYETDGLVVKADELPGLWESCGNKVSSSGLKALIVVISILATLIVLLVIFLLRYSWVIKALLFSKGWGCLLFWEDKNEEEDQQKIYDAFVSFSHKDEDFVMDELVSKLEEEQGFKLCLHMRDWMPGDWIPDQIIRSVDQSRRTLVVLSKNFMESIWSRLEFKAAHAQALSGGNSQVILVLLEDDLSEKDVEDEDLKVYMRMNTYLKWKDPWFWHKLKYALPHRGKGPSKTEGDDSSNAEKLKHFQQKEKARELDKMRTELEHVA